MCAGRVAIGLCVMCIERHVVLFLRLMPYTLPNLEFGIMGGCITALRSRDQGLVVVCNPMCGMRVCILERLATWACFIDGILFSH